eukprot:scaffold31018_cov63-Phaeocystis_antarctica.AAC.23
MAAFLPLSGPRPPRTVPLEVSGDPRGRARHRAGGVGRPRVRPTQMGPPPPLRLVQIGAARVIASGGGAPRNERAYPAPS